MRYEFCTRTLLSNEFLEIDHITHHRLAILERLLHRRYYYALDTLRFYHLALREAAVEKCNGIESYFGSLFGKPLNAVHVLCGSNCYVHTALPILWFLQWCTRHNITMLATDGINCSPVQVPLAISYLKFAAHRQAQNAQSVSRLLLGEFPTLCNIRYIKKCHFTEVLFYHYQCCRRTPRDA